MDAFVITPTLSPAPASPQGQAGSPAEASANGLSFGGIFSALRPEAGRQDLAAGLLNPDMPLPQLVSHPLGEAMAVITADTPMPAQDSLLAFARSQGLDEAAIAALWQQPAQTVTGTANAAPGNVLAGNAAATLPGAGLPAQLSAALTPTAANALASAVPATPGAGPLPLANTNAAPAAAPVAASALNVQLMGLVVQPLPTPGKTPAPTATPSAAQEPDPLLVSSLRLTPQTLGLRAPQRPQLTAPTGQTPVSDKMPNKPSQEPPTLTLDLESELAELTREPVDNAGLERAPATSSATPLPTEPARTSGASPSASSSVAPAPTIISGYQLKLEHYQQLADRMGHALAQRLQEQIESGQWSLKLRLNPVELGQIDVQLDMHAGGLDARFQTDNPLTKDLILQGSGRLKDSLNEHGTTVASVWVNSDDRRQSGGNSTPQQQQRRASPGPNPSGSEPVVQAPAPRPSRADGWDMLA